MSGEWWPVSDAAQFAEVSRRTISRWVHDGRLSHQDRPNGTHVDLDELVELVEHRGPGGRLPKTPRASQT